MAKYVLKRLGYAVLTLFVLVTLTFFTMQLLPGDPFTGEKKVPEEVLASIKAKYGLDKPVFEQYLMYLGNCLHGDLGDSMVTKRAVTDVLLGSFSVSFDLGMRALIFAFVGGVLLGIIAAVKRGTPWDTLTMIIALVGVSVPSFIVGSFLQFLLGPVSYTHLDVYKRQAAGLRSSSFPASSSVRPSRRTKNRGALLP